MSNVKNPIRTIVTDFRAGELDPKLYMRVDTKVYPSGAKSLRNSLLSNTGAIAARPGTTMLDALSGRRRLVPFEYDANEKYILAFGVNALEIYEEDGTLVTSFSGSTDCPWETFNQVRNITYAQRADVMIICCKQWKPKVLTRTGLSSFSIADFAFDKAPNNAEVYQPYDKFEDADVTLTPSATTGTITITASSSIFSADWVGDRIRIYGKEILITGHTNGTTITGAVKKELKKRLDPNPFLTREASDVIEVTDAFHGLDTGASVTFSGADSSNGIGRTEMNTTRTITVLDEDHYTFVTPHVTADDYIAEASGDMGGPGVEVTSLAATRQWDEQVFSDRRGWPSAVCFHEDRLWFGGSIDVPDGIWSSRTGDYYNFDIGEAEDDASIQLSVGAGRISVIRHMVSSRVLQIFTDGGEFVAKQSDGVALTPSNVSIRAQTAYGVSAVAPRPFDGAVLMVQGNGKTVREFVYDYNQDAFQGTDLVTLSAHLIDSPVDLDVLYGSATRTEQYAFVVNDDGTVAVFQSNRSEGLAAWVPWDTPDGDFDSVVVLGTKVFFAVLRDATYYLERLDLDETDQPLDFAISLTAGAVTTAWSLGADYAGLTLHCTSGGHYLGAFTADGSGDITLDTAVDELQAGLEPVWELTPLPPDIQMPDGPMTGQVRRIVAVTLHLHQTQAISVNGRAFQMRQVGADFSLPPDALTGKYRRVILGYAKDPTVPITRPVPLPVTVLGLVMEVSL